MAQLIAIVLVRLSTVGGASGLTFSLVSVGRAIGRASAVTTFHHQRFYRLGVSMGKFTRPLPWYPGPKLHAFESQLQDQANEGRPKIRFLNRLGAGLHGEVHRVEVMGKIYALKLVMEFLKPIGTATNFYPQFKFHTWRNLVDFAYFDNNSHMTVKQIVSESDPFNCECRAFGRLKETNNEHVAVKCYGYVILSDEEERDLKTQSGVDWTRPRGQAKLGIRGIIKEYLPDTKAFERKMMPIMRQDMLSLHKLGICVFDLRAGNYMMGKIVDFSQAMVVPHRDLDLKNSPDRAKYHSNADFVAFDGVVEDWNTEHPDQEYRQFFTPTINRNLRNMKAVKSRLYKPTERYTIAAEYDWLKANKLRQQSKRSREDEDENEDHAVASTNTIQSSSTRRKRTRRR